MRRVVCLRGSILGTLALLVGLLGVTSVGATPQEGGSQRLGPPLQLPGDPPSPHPPSQHSPAYRPVSLNERLQLNPHLNYDTNGRQGPLITGNHKEEGLFEGLPNYVIFLHAFCFNSKRQARRTVELHERYKGRVHFLIVDLDEPLSLAQSNLVKRYFKGSVPQSVVLNSAGKLVFNYTGEADEATLAGWLDFALRWP